MSTLENIIPNPNVRKKIYQVFAAVGLVITITQVAVAAIGQGQPDWLNVVLAVYGALGAAGFGVAQSNTDTDGTRVLIAPQLETEPAELVDTDQPEAGATFEIPEEGTQGKHGVA